MHAITLTAHAGGLLERAASASSGRAADTVHAGSGGALRQTLLALTAGAAGAEHEFLGHVRLTSAGESREARRGDLIPVPEARRGLQALEDSAVLLTVAERP